MKTKVPITYTGSNTENLYVLGIRNGREVKLKVKEIGCHGPIKVSQIVEDKTSYLSKEELDAAKEEGKLEENTIYIINEGGIEIRYLYYDNILTTLGDDGGLTIGGTFSTLHALENANKKGELSTQKIYTVTDKGTIEQYILSDGKLLQIAGAINEIVAGDEADENKSSTSEDEDGIIDYNLSELVNGDYRFKNHINIHTVYCDLPSLVSGVQMFYGTSLTSFCGNLNSLENGRQMFSKGCKLDEESIISIVDGIKIHPIPAEYTKEAFGDHLISIGYNSATVSQTFLREITNEFNAKGWWVDWYPEGSLQKIISKYF